MVNAKTVVAALSAGSMLANSDAFSIQLKPELKMTMQLEGSDVKALHINEAPTLVVKLEWDGNDDTPLYNLEDDSLYWKMSWNEQLLEEKKFNLSETNFECFLPTKIEVPAPKLESAGFYLGEFSISTKSTYPKNETFSTDTELYGFGRGWSMFPLIVVLFLAVVTRKVEVALGLGVFFGSFLVTGLGVSSAFKTSLDTYILKAAADEGHVFVILFTLFLSGLVGLMDKSGGILGLANSLTKFAKSSKSAQFVAFCCGFLLFFDDYTNALVVGNTMRPITDLVFVSREKLAFVVDATSAPVAAIFPVSSWVGFETNEIGKQLDKIKKLNNGVMPEGIKETGFAVYLESIPWRLYPILMLVFQVVSILSGREFGPMLIAERLTRIYKRTDGGDGAMQTSKKLMDVNAPSKSTPQRWWNMIIPVVLLVFLILWVLIQTGLSGLDEEIENPTIADTLSSADSYVALLYGTMGTSLLALILYAIQFKSDGNIVPPHPKGVCAKKTKITVAGDDGQDDDDEEYDFPVPLLTPSESIDAWLHGMIVIFPAIVVLVLAWAVAAIMTDVGADRLFADLVISGNVGGNLAALTFILSFFMALCTGTSWGTMGIMYPLILVTASKVALQENDVSIFYAVVGSILSGAVAGDHCSPISDTTVLSSTGSQCDLTKHVITQLPYALLVFFWALLTGYLPGGRGAYSAGVAILIGSIAVIVSVFVIGVPVVHSTGRFDPLTELYIRMRNPKLKEDTIEFAQNGELEEEGIVAKEEA